MVAGELGVSVESVRIWLRRDQVDRSEDGLSSDGRVEVRRLLHSETVRAVRVPTERIGGGLSAASHD